MCDTARETLSAQLDGEAGPAPLDDARQHMAACSACRAWYAAAADVSRRARLGVATETPDLTGRVLAAARREGLLDRASRDHASALLPARRLALVLIALGQLALAAPMLLLGHDHTAPLHVAHELGSLDVAVAVGLLVAALRPHLAPGMVPLVGVAAALLGVTAVADLAAARTSLGDEVPHLLDLVGFLLLWRLSRPRRRPIAPSVHAERRPAA